MTDKRGNLAMKHRRIAAVLAGVAATVVVLTGCSTTSPNSGESTASVPQDSKKPSSLTMLVTTSGSENGLKSLAKTYEQKTGITINFVEVASGDLPTKEILAAKSKQNTFDLAMVDGFTLASVAAAGALVPLDSYLKDDTAYDYDADFPQGLKDYAKYKDVSYTVPLSTEPYLQWYRADLYDELGLKPATTWDEVTSNAKALQTAGYLGYNPLYNAAGAAHFYNEMLVSQGGRMFDPKTLKPLLDTDVAKKVMNQYLALKQYGPSSSTSGATANAVQAFQQQNAGQMVLASGWWPTINGTTSPVAGKVATAETPLGKLGTYTPTSMLYGWLAGISSASPHQKDAWEFLSWALGKDNVSAFIDAGAAPPARISTTSNHELVAKAPYLTAEAEAVKTGTTLPRIPAMSQIVSVISQGINAMATGQQTVDAGMAAMQSSVLNILVQAGAYKGN
ncbi:extracellular solute-binding protein [Microbacterium panaciterrae]|uniref:Sugar ABC transporter substrate-binding protein n=1 Tax=Microbacterium panaciterrae TaxID=985759 RepID=A0ABP8P3J7_9MICO